MKVVSAVKVDHFKKLPTLVKLTYVPDCLCVLDSGIAPSRDIRQAPAVRRDGMRHLPAPTPRRRAHVHDGRAVPERHPPMDYYGSQDGLLWITKWITMDYCGFVWICMDY